MTERIYVEFETGFTSYCTVRREITRYETGERVELEITPFSVSGGRREYHQPFCVPANTEGFEYRLDRVF